jgi:formylmethanofuran dehydrogenase subunit E
MPDEELFSVTPVVLATPLKDIVSRAAARARCASCGEEIINDRQVLVEGTTYCRSCAGPSYFHILT